MDNRIHSPQGLPDFRTCGSVASSRGVMKEENPMTVITEANDPRLLRLRTLMDEAGGGAIR
jgi:hypothetical protein